MPKCCIYLTSIPGDNEPSALYLNAIKLNVCQYQLKEAFVCAIVLSALPADTVQCERAVAETWLAGMVRSVLTARLELIDTVCQHPECPQRAMTVAFTRMSFGKSLMGKYTKTCTGWQTGCPSGLEVPQCQFG